MSEPIKVTLSKPIEAHGEETRELTFREIKVGDLRGVKVSIGEDGLSFDLGVMIDLGAKLAGIPTSSMDKLQFQDVMAIGQAVAPLLEGFLSTGKMSSPD